MQFGTTKLHANDLLLSLLLIFDAHVQKNVKIWVHDGIPFFTLIYYYLT